MKATKTLPDQIGSIVAEWMGDCDVIHFWESDDTYYIVTTGDDKDLRDIYFLRVFQIGGRWTLSQDAESRPI